MANRYWVGGTATWDATAGTKWSTTSGGGGGSSVPTTADDVFFDANSGTGTITLSSSSTARSINCTGFTGTISHPSSTTITIGDGTAGAGNVALLLVSGMTYTLTSTTTSALNFNSSSTTLQTITFGGKSVGNLTIAGTGCDYAFTDNLTQSTTATLTFTRGTLHMDGVTDNSGLTHTIGIFNSNNSNTRTLTMGNVTANVRGSGNAFDFRTSTNLTFQCGTSTIDMSGGSSGFLYGGNGGGLTTFYTVIFRGGSHGVSNAVNHSGSVFTNLTITGTASKTDSFLPTSNCTVTGTLTINGDSVTNRILIGSNTFGSARSYFISGATVVASNVDIRDTTFNVSTDLSAITGGSGDCAGNSGITFTTAQTNYWVGNGGSWSDVNKWSNTSGGSSASGRVPLPQDDVIFDANSFSSASQTITMDMPRIGNDITMTNIDSSPALSKSITVTQYGSLAFGTGLGSTAFSGGWNFHGRSKTCTLNLAGKTVNGGGSGTWTIFMIGGTLQLTASFQMTAVSDRVLALSGGTFDSNGFSVNIGRFTSTSGTRTVTMGSSVWTLTTDSFNAWETSSGLTVNAGTSEIQITNTGSLSKTFVGSNKNYYNLRITTGGSGAIVIQGNNTFNKIYTSGSTTKTINFTAGSTQTFTGGTDCFFSGTSGNLITCQSTSSGSAWTVSKSSGYVSCDYLSLKDSTATGGASWFAGNNSTNVSGNSGWIFTNPIFNELLDFTIVSDTQLTDFQTYTETLNFVIVSDINLTDLQIYTETLNFIINSDSNILDIQNYVDNLNVLIVSITDIIDELEYAKLIKPIFLVRKRIIGIDLTRKIIIPIKTSIEKVTNIELERNRIINLKSKKSEPIKISLKRKTW